jgi:hypothetical protein
MSVTGANFLRGTVKTGLVASSSSRIQDSGMRSLTSINSSLRIFCTSFSGTGSRPSPRYDPAGTPHSDGWVKLGMVGPSGADNTEVAEVASNGVGLFPENTGSHENALDGGMPPIYSAH